MLNFFGVVVFHTSMVNWREGYICPKYSCAFCYVLNIFSVVVFHTSMVKRRGLGLCVFSVCETSLV